MGRNNQNVSITSAQITNTATSKAVTTLQAPHTEATMTDLSQTTAK